MTDQQLITEYPTSDDPPEPAAEPSGEPVRFDLEADSSSIDRARDSHADIEALDAGTYSVAFADGDHDHEVELQRTPDGWRADCWTLNDDGTRIGRCRGWVHHSGPCAHLWAARSHIARERLSDDDQRHSTDVERALADGGHHLAEEGGRR